MAQSQTTTRILDIQVKYDEAIAGIAKYKAEIDDLKARQKEYARQLKEGVMSEAEYQRAMAASDVAIRERKNACNALNKTIQNQIKTEKENEGSLKSLRAQLSLLTDEYDSLSKTERENAKGQELQQKISDITEQLKGAEYETERFYRNVGNYPQAVQGVKEELKAITEQLINMKVAGEQGSDQWNELVKRAGDLKDAIGDTRQEINNYASDTADLDSLKEGITSITDAYTAFKVATDMAGFQNETLDKTMAALAGTLTVINTLQTIQNALQSQSALMKGVNTVKTWLYNTALGAQAVATEAVTAAEGKATAATWLWNAALAANPLVWLVAIVSAAIGVVYGLVKAFEYFSSGSESRKQQLQEEGEALSKLTKLHEDAIAMAEARGATNAKVSDLTIKNLRAELDAWERHFSRIKELYDEDSEEYKNALQKKEDAQTNLEAALKKGLLDLTKVQESQRNYEKEKALGVYEYKRQLIQQEIFDQSRLAYTLYQMGEMTLEQYEQMCKDLGEIQKRLIAEVDEEEKKAQQDAADRAAADAKRRNDAARTAAENRKKEQERQLSVEADLIRKAEDELTKLILDQYEKERQLILQKYDRQISDYKTKLETDKTLTEESRKAINSIIASLEEQKNRELDKLSEDHFKKELSDREKMIRVLLEAVEEGSEEEYRLKKEQLENQRDMEVREEELTQEMILAIYRKYDKLIEDLDKERNEAILKRQSDAAKQRLQAETDIMNAQHQLELDMLELAGADDKQIKYQKQYQEYEEYMMKVRVLEQQLNDMRIQDGESQADFELRQSAIRQQISANETKAKLADYRLQKQGLHDLMGGLDAMGEHSKAFAKMSKVLALAEIAINTGKAIAAGVAQAQSMPFPANLGAIATTVGVILSNVASAISTVKAAKFAKGGKVEGPGSGTSDSIPAMLSNGEFVMTAAATRTFEPLLRVMNAVSPSMPNMNQQAPLNTFAQSPSEIQADRRRFMSDLESALERMPAPVVTVEEINTVSKRVEVLEHLDNI